MIRAPGTPRAIGLMASGSSSDLIVGEWLHSARIRVNINININFKLFGQSTVPHLRSQYTRYNLKLFA